MKAIDESSPAYQLYIRCSFIVGPVIYAGTLKYVKRFKDEIRSLDLIEKVRPFLNKRDMKFLDRWFESLPDHQVREWPKLVAILKNVESCDGPSQPGKWFHNGTEIEFKLSGIPLLFVRFLWRRPHRRAKFDRLAGPVYDEEAIEVEKERIKYLQKATNAAFRASRLPWWVHYDATDLREVWIDDTPIERKIVKVAKKSRSRVSIKTSGKTSKN